MDRGRLHLICGEVESAIQDVLKRHNLAVSDMGIYAHTDGLETKIVIRCVEKTPEALQLSKDIFEQESKCLGFNRKMGDRFLFNRQWYVITGINSRRPKYPVSARCEATGKLYKFPIGSVVSA